MERSPPEPELPSGLQGKLRDRKCSICGTDTLELWWESETVLADDPMLNTRDFSGKRSPVRIICDSRLRIPLDSQIVKTAKGISDDCGVCGKCSNDENNKSRRCSETGKWMNDEIVKKDLRAKTSRTRGEVYEVTQTMNFRKKIQELEKTGRQGRKASGKSRKS